MRQRSTAAAELRGWRREEDEEGTEGEKKWPFGPIYKAKEHESGATIKGPQNGAIASISADLLNKEA